MIKYFLFMHIMIADPNMNIPKVYDFWFEEEDLRYFNTEKDCKDKSIEILQWARQTMEAKNLIVLNAWADCIEVKKGEKTSYNYKYRGFEKVL